jgi:signal peptidase
MGRHSAPTPKKAASGKTASGKTASDKTVSVNTASVKTALANTASIKTVPADKAAAKKEARRAARENKSSDSTPATRTLWQTIRTGLSVGLFSIVVALMVAAVIIPKLTGATPLTVLTSSMEPGLPPGTLLVVEAVDPNLVEVGDVVTYQIESGQPAVVTHRVIAVNSSSDGERTFTFQGDNNDSADPLVIADQIQGRLWYSIPWIGYASTLLNGPYRAWILPIAAGAMLLYAAIAIPMGIVGAVKKSKAKKRADSDATEANIIGAVEQ